MVLRLDETSGVLSSLVLVHSPPPDSASRGGLRPMPPTLGVSPALGLSSGRAAPLPPSALSQDSSILLHPAPEAAASAGKCKQGPGYT